MKTKKKNLILDYISVKKHNMKTGKFTVIVSTSDKHGQQTKSIKEDLMVKVMNLEIGQ